MITKNVLSLGDAEFLLDAAQKKSEEFGGIHVICIADDADPRIIECGNAHRTSSRLIVPISRDPRSGGH